MGQIFAFNRVEVKREQEGEVNVWCQLQLQTPCQCCDACMVIMETLKGRFPRAPQSLLEFISVFLVSLLVHVSLASGFDVWDGQSSLSKLSLYQKHFYCR